MAKRVLILATSIFFVGCGSQSISPPSLPVISYSHPTHGEVTLPNEVYKSDRDSCTSVIYSKGVLIDGVLVTDPELIGDYRNDAVMFALRDSEMNLRRALAEFKGPSAYNNLNHDPTKSDEYYEESWRVDNDITECMNQEGWEKVGEVANN